MISLHDIIHYVFKSGYLTLLDRVNYSTTCTRSASKYMTLPVLLDGIIHSSIDKRHRFKFWKWALSRKLDKVFEVENPVEFYLSHIEDMNEANCLSSGQLGEIMRDVGRTFPEHPIFARIGLGEQMLANILKATVSVRPDIGYCQGMNFVVGALLLGRLEAEWDLFVQLSTGSIPLDECFPLVQRHLIESDIFWTTQRLLANSGEGHVGDSGVLQMESIWSPGFPKMKIRVYQFDRLFKWNLPELFSHCETIMLSTEVMVSQWFMTLFAYMFPLEYTHQIWNYIFLSGWPGVFKVTLAMMYNLSDKLMDMDLEQVGLMIRDWKRGKFSLAVSVTQILQSAEKFNVTIETLNALQEGYALEIIKAALAQQKFESKSLSTNSSPSSSPEKYTPSQSKDAENVSIVYKELVDLEVQVEKDKEVIQKKILLACEACESTITTLTKAIHEEAVWIEKTTNIKFELEKWTTKVTTLVSVIHGIDEAEQNMTSSPGPVEPYTLEEDSAAIIGQIINMTESVDDHDDYDCDEMNLKDDSSCSTIEEEHAKLAEEYEDGDFYQDENDSAESSTSSVSEFEHHVGQLIEGDEDEQEEDEEEEMCEKVDGDVESHDSVVNNHQAELKSEHHHHQHQHQQRSSPQAAETSQNFFTNLLKPLSNHSPSPEIVISTPSPNSIQEDSNHTNNGQRFDPRLLSRPQSQNQSPGSEVERSTPPPSSPEYLSVVEKMKSHPNRRRIIGIVQNTGVSYRNATQLPPPKTSSSSIPNPIGKAQQLDDPSIIADSLLRARNMSLELLPQPQEEVTVDKEIKEVQGSPKEEVFLNITIENVTNGIENERIKEGKKKKNKEKEKEIEKENETDGKNKDMRNHKDQQKSNFNKSNTAKEVEVEVEVEVEEETEKAEKEESNPSSSSPGAEKDSKTFSSFKFSSKIREGLDVFYRATSVPLPSTNGKIATQGASNSLLALAEKERHRWMRRKTDLDKPSSVSSPSNSKELKSRRIHFPTNGLRLLNRERLLSSRKRAQMAAECRKYQLKVAKLTRALDVAKRKLQVANSVKIEALMADEESKQWKESLCHQFQLLVEDSTRCRSQKLLHIAETYGG